MATKGENRKFFEVRGVEVRYDPDKNRVGVKLEVLKGSEQGTVKWYNGSFDERFAEYTVEALKHLGWDGEDNGLWNGIGTTKALAVEEDHEYAGTVSRIVKYINAWKPYQGTPKKGTKRAHTSGGVLGPKYKSLLKSVKVEVDPGARLAGVAQDANEVEDDPF